MSTITGQLRAEHEVIQKGLDLLEDLGTQLSDGKNISFSEARTLVYALQLEIEKVHHVKEELLLFPALAAHPKLQEGGPKCTHYMGLRIEDDIVSHILGPDRDSTPKPVETRAKSQFDSSCALSIPMEEHEAGHVGLLRVQLALDSLERGQERPNRLVTAIREYVHLMRRHIEKEDTCLFVLADSLLTDEEQRVLFEKACEIDRISSPEMLREMRLMLDRLWTTSIRSSA